MSNVYFQPPEPYNEPVLDYRPASHEKQLLEAELHRQSQTVHDIPIVIDGHEHHTAETVAVVCPHDKAKILAKTHQATAEHAHIALEVATSKTNSWADMPAEARAAVFLKAADLLTTKYRARLNAATMLGQSKTVHQAEIEAACELADFFRFNVSYMAQILRDQPPESPRGQWNRVEYRALEGFVYAVTPFNFTAIAINLPTAPALMGCRVIWKPAPTSIHAAYLGYQILLEAGLPPDVISFLPGEPEGISNVLLASPHLAGIHFTGSTKTFNHLWQEVAKNLPNYRTYPRLVGETGGKDYVFAHPSANVDNLVTALIRGAFEYQGQKCSAASRAYIPKSLWPAVKEQLVAKTEELKMGSPLDHNNFLCAVIDERAFQKITEAIRAAETSSEAEVIAGGQFDDSEGYFIRPTVIEVKDPQYATMTTELFGPVLSVFVYEDDALETTLDVLDTSTPYGLTGAIFAKDRRDIQHLLHRLRHTAGNFYINDKPTGAVVGQQPFGGSRGSGTNDKAGSYLNLTRWVSARAIKENFLDMPDHTYPYMGS